MALSIKTVSHKVADSSNRLDAKYFFLQDSIEKYSNDKTINLVPLGQKGLIIQITDGEHAGQTFVKKGVLFIKNSSIKDFDISVNDGFYISEEKHKVLSRSALKKEDVLFTTIGHLGSTAIVPDNFGEANINQNLVRMKINRDFVNPYYLAAFLNSQFVRKQINCLLTGNIQSIMTYPKIKDIKVIIPKVEIQNLVEAKYKKALELETDANNLIEDTKQILLKALSFEKGSITNDKYFEIRSDDLFQEKSLWTPKYYYPKYVTTANYITTNFENYKLGKIATIKKGDEVGSDLYISYLEKKDTDVPFIRTSDIYNYQIDLSPDNFVDCNSYNELNQDLKLGDILFTKDGKVAEIGLITKSDKAILASGIDIIRINKKGKELGLTQEYIFALLVLTEIGQYAANRRTVVASTIPHLKEEYIKEFEIPVIDKNYIRDVTNNIAIAFEKKEQRKKLIIEIINIINEVLTIKETK